MELHQVTASISIDDTKTLVIDNLTRFGKQGWQWDEAIYWKGVFEDIHFYRTNEFGSGLFVKSPDDEQFTKEIDEREFNLGWLNPPSIFGKLISLRFPAEFSR